MLQIAFGGWFQCRLATDPDPYDEPRGVSGYVHAYAGEPDLDRLIQWQKPEFTRDLGPPIGVRVEAVSIDGIPQEKTELLGASAMLNGHPKFEGRNGVIAEDGYEPIYPFDLQITSKTICLQRSVVPFDPDYPYESLGAPGVDMTARDEIVEATGVTNLLEVWASRLEQLTKLGNLSEPRKTAVRERIRFLEENLARGPAGASRYFGARMRYQVDLNSSAPVVDGLVNELKFHPEINDEWRAKFWLGGWDADVLCGYCKGSLVIPQLAGPVLPKAPALPAGIHRDRV